MVGADLANLVNEAALLAARRGHDRVNTADFADALEKIVLGTARGIMLSPEETRADRLPRVGARAARHAHARRRPGPQGVDHSPRPGAGRDVPGAGGRPVRLLGDVSARAGSSERSVAVPPRRSSTATSPRARRATWTRSATSPGRWSAAGACRARSARSPFCRRRGRSRRWASTVSRRPPRSSSTGRSGASSTSATRRPSPPCSPTATSSTGWRTPCSRRRPSTRTRRTRPRGCPATSAPGALARGDVPVAQVGGV